MFVPKIGNRDQKKLGETSCHIIVPTSPKLAIVTGAVMWRKNPDLTKTHRVDAKYGIDVQSPFDKTNMIFIIVSIRRNRKAIDVMFCSFSAKK